MLFRLSPLVLSRSPAWCVSAWIAGGCVCFRVRSGGSRCPVRGVVALAGVCVPLWLSALVLGGSRGSRSISALQAAYKVRVYVSGSYSADKGKAGGFLLFPCEKVLQLCPLRWAKVQPVKKSLGFLGQGLVLVALGDLHALGLVDIRINNQGGVSPFPGVRLIFCGGRYCLSKQRA